MLLNSKPLESLAEADLQALIDNSVPEGKTIDYKRDPLGSTDADKKEFLYDVSSFANTSGGYLIFGMDEAAGLPTHLSGMAISDPDSETLKLHNIIRDGLDPRIPGIAIRSIPLQNQQVAIVLRIPSSWASPHMVIFKGSSKFYGRNSAGKYQMDVREIRTAFSQSESLVERLRSFRRERLQLIASEENPAQMMYGAKLVLHIIPLAAFELVNQFDVTVLAKLAPGPIDSMGWDERYNLDGCLKFACSSRSHSERRTSGYVQAFRNGIFEIVDAKTIEPHIDKSLLIRPYFEEELLNKLKEVLSAQKALDIEPPILIMLSLLGMKGYQMAPIDHSRRGHPIDRDNLLIPEVMIESFDTDLPSRMKPIFDVVWNAAGWSRSHGYDISGKWVGGVSR